MIVIQDLEEEERSGVCPPRKGSSASHTDGSAGGGGALTGAPSEKAVVLSVRVVVSLGISEQNFLTSVKLSLFNDMGTVNYNINFLICDSNFVPVVDDDII